MAKNFIRKLRDLGAIRVRFGDIDVQFEPSREFAPMRHDEVYSIVSDETASITIPARPSAVVADAYENDANDRWFYKGPIPVQR